MENPVNCLTIREKHKYKYLKISYDLLSCLNTSVYMAEYLFVPVNKI